MKQSNLIVGLITSIKEAITIFLVKYVKIVHINIENIIFKIR